MESSRPRKLDSIRWNWACVKVKASVIGTASKASPAPFPSPFAIFKRSPPLALLYAVRKARPQRPSLSARDFPTGAPTGPRASPKPGQARPDKPCYFASPTRPWSGRACQEIRPGKPGEARRPDRASALLAKSDRTPQCLREMSTKTLLFFRFYFYFYFCTKYFFQET